VSSSTKSGCPRSLALGDLGQHAPVPNNPPLPPGTVAFTSQNLQQGYNSSDSAETNRNARSRKVPS
jgi:hypothetical protein